MRNILSVIFLFVFIFPLRGTSSEGNLKTVLRIRPEADAFRIICRAMNVSGMSVTVDSVLLSGSNYFHMNFLNDTNRVGYDWSLPGELPPNEISITPGMQRQWKMDDRYFQDLHVLTMYNVNSQKQNLDDKRGSYIKIKWHLNPFESPDTILLGFIGKDGRLRKPVVKSGSNAVEALLGFVYHENNPLGLGFLVLNGSDETLALEKPLTRNSRIIATSPTIGYNRELVTPNSTAEDAVVEAGEVGEWRLPWQTVINLIPQEDLDKIKAAGGDLDLVWKVGDYQSDPLPISLADPVGISIEE